MSFAEGCRDAADGAPAGWSRRVRLFLGLTFPTTWVAWWALAVLSSRGALTPDEPLALGLLVLGGSAPGVMAYVAVWRTPEAGTLREFNRRVLRLRAPPVLVVVAVSGAAGLGIVSLLLVGLVTGTGRSGDPGRIVSLFLAAFVTSLLLGGSRSSAGAVSCSTR